MYPNVTQTGGDCKPDSGKQGGGGSFDKGLARELLGKWCGQGVIGLPFGVGAEILWHDRGRGQAFCPAVVCVGRFHHM
ncbi:MAG: hypothetical protein COB69_10560 [Phycisphaera sp.]|nr:MAG: hypothetical protein COB69_10560 [Phycisphaera sp.]